MKKKRRNKKSSQESLEDAGSTGVYNPERDICHRRRGIMPATRLAMIVKRIAAGAAFAFCTVSFPAQAASVIVDGNLSDLESIPWIAALPWDTSALNVYRGTDPLGSADSPTSESNNGFDISNVYAYYDWTDDTFYFGMKFYGTVGDSQPFDSLATNEGFGGNNSRQQFDANETYGIQLYLGTTTADPQLLLYNVQGASNDTDTDLVGNNPFGLTIAHGVSEAFNGVEFGVTGLRSTGAAPEPHPNLFTIRFSAGSADVGGATSMAAEDYHLVTMSAIPVPAAVWLFGSGLAGLLAVARKRRNNS
jgi:hypothetical protein